MYNNEIEEQIGGREPREIVHRDGAPEGCVWSTKVDETNFVNPVGHEVFLAPAPGGVLEIIDRDRGDRTYRERMKMFDPKISEAGR